MRIVVPRDARDHGYLALKIGRGGFGRRRSWFGGGARSDGELLGLLVLGGLLVLQLVFGRVVFRERRPVSGGLWLVGQPVLGG